MKLNEMQKAFVVPCLVLGYIVVKAFIMDYTSIGRAGAVFFIILSFLVPYLLFSREILSKNRWYQSRYLWLCNIVFFINWFYSCFWFYRKVDSISFVEFYRVHFETPNTFTFILFGGSLYCLFMLNLTVKGIYKNKLKL